MEDTTIQKGSILSRLQSLKQHQPMTKSTETTINTTDTFEKQQEDKTACYLPADASPCGGPCLIVKQDFLQDVQNKGLLPDGLAEQARKNIEQ